MMITDEDYIGRKVVVGQNDWGLGRWATIESFTCSKEWDDDHGYWALRGFEVRFNDRSYGWISQEDVNQQLEMPGS